MDNYLPVKNLFIPVDKADIISRGVVTGADTANIVPRVEWTLNKSTLLKPNLLVLDIIQANNWKRPIYFAISVNSDEYLGLNDYLQQEGLTYRLVPIKNKSGDGLPGKVNTDIMYENVMNFWWGGIDKYNVYLDENILRMVSNLRSNFARLANALIAEGKKDKAINVLDKCLEVLPEKNVPYSLLMLPIAQAYYKADAADKGKQVLKKLVNVYADNMRYITALDNAHRAYYRRDMNEAVYVFSEASQLAEKSNDTELLNLVKPLFDKYRPYYSFDQREQESEE
jgi:tetratricopeptide (TPR) repeat protein